MTQQSKNNQESVLGNFYAIIAYVAWGLLPVYWKLLKDIPADEILAHRMVWSCVFVGGLLIFQNKKMILKKVIVDGKMMLKIFMASMFITMNWFIYIWAVNSNHIVEASMGYYINPLIIILLGRMVLKEQFNLWQGISIGLAMIGVMIMTIQYGKIPWIALGLATSFSMYGLLKKLIPIDSIVGLFIETLLMAPFALLYLIYKEIMGMGTLQNLPTTTLIILLCAGIITATPLLWFSKGAKAVSLSTMGFYQYIAPTLSLILGVFCYQETFSTYHWISFGFIWVALSIYTISRCVGIKNKSKRSIK